MKTLINLAIHGYKYDRPLEVSCHQCIYGEVTDLSGRRGIENQF